VSQGRSVVRGVFAVLDVLNGADGLGPTELATRAKLPKATTHRILEQLVGEGAVERVDGRYRLGPTMFRLGQWRPAQRLRAAARLPMRELAAALPGVSVNVSLPFRGGTIVASALPGASDAMLPLRDGAWLVDGCELGVLWAARSPDKEPPEGVPVAEWRRRVRAARARDGIVAPSLMHVPDLSVVSLPVHDRTGTLLGCVAGLMIGDRQLRRLEAVVGRAARLTRGNLARI
jgi:IclR family transcriptional regulator, acetate operon repressor